jgi:uncharacterized damage-inducible protein DinB
VDTISLFIDLFRHMDWADALTWHSVLGSPSAINDQTIRERLHHIHLCQQAWLRIWLAESVDPHAGESLGIPGLASWAREYHRDVARYLARVEESHLEVRVAVPGSSKESQQPSLWETFLQITAHSTYHRGQVSSQLRELGGEPPQTDFIRWVVLGRPEAMWPNEVEMEVKPGS